MSEANKKTDVLSEDALDAFINRTAEQLAKGGAVAEKGGGLEVPEHRRLRVVTSEDRLEAYLEAVFPDTTYAEVCAVLKNERIAWGIREDAIKRALAQADRSGRRQKDVLVAKGQPAVYIKRKEVSYPFLERLEQADSHEPVHVASSVFREIAEVLSRDHIDRIRGYAHPVVAVTQGTILMRVQGEDEIEFGKDVFGKVIRQVADGELRPLKVGDGVEEEPGGSLVALKFGYVSIVGRFLTVISPIWISSDRMEAYFVNPPQLGKRCVPDPADVLRGLNELGICLGIEEKIIQQMCRDLNKGALRESCVRVARGQRPQLSKGQIAFTFEPISPAQFERVQDALGCVDLEDVTACETAVHVIQANALIAEQAEETDDNGAGKDLFGKPVAPPEQEQETKVFKAGNNVRREVRQGRVCYFAEAYGYAGVIGNRITVLSPIWVSPDRMAAHFIALPQEERAIHPTDVEVNDLLERSRVCHGIDPEAIASLCRRDAIADDAPRAVLLAQGTPPTPGQDGNVELHFKRTLDPGKVLEDGEIDFRERGAVPNAEAGHLLAVRFFPTEGVSGTDVQGRTIKPPKSQRDLLYVGANVVTEKEGREQRFYAARAGFARVTKDTLSVLQRFRHSGDVDYEVGNIHFDGDVEIAGTVKNGFKVEATGDVFIDGTVENRARVVAKGDVVIRGGIIGGKVKSGGTLYAKFIQDAEVEAGEDLVVRNYVQKSQVQVKRKATIQGDAGGKQQLCLLGGVIQTGLGIEASSIGSQYGRPTRVIVGVDPDVEARLSKYRKGLAVCEAQSRRVMRSVLNATGGARGKQALERVLRQASEGRRAFLLGLLEETQEMSKLQESLEFHIEELKKAQEEAVRLGRIRVTGKVFTRVTVQVGDVYRQIEEEVEAVVFSLNKDGNQVAYSALSHTV